MHTSRIKATFVLAVLAVSVLASTDLNACSTPVFRYALEKWPSDYFPAVVFHRGELSAEHKAILEVFRTAARKNGANVGVYQVDVSKKLDKGTAELWKRHSKQPLPCLAVTYALPYSGRGRGRYPDDPFPPTIWSGKLTKANALALVDSPVRREIAKRILAGDSAVWIILEPAKAKKTPAKGAAPAKKDKSPAAPAATKAQESSAEKDPKQAGEAEAKAEAPKKPVPAKVAAATLTKVLAKATKLFADNPNAQPPAQVAPGEAPPANIKIAFSTIRVSRDTPAERMLVAMLLGSEKDLRDAEYDGETMVFPLFGRGRVLWALVGRGINEENIFESCAYICGACSCEVKWQNPGTDLLFSKDWDKALYETMVEDQPLPMLRGLPDDKPKDKPKDKAKDKAKTDAKARPASPDKPAAKER